MTADKFSYAVWYEDDHCNHYFDIFQSEEKAARFACEIEAHTGGSVHGVQRSDGALQQSSSWPRYLQLAREESERWKNQWQESRNNPPELIVRNNPFFPGVKIHIEKDENVPDWLGVSDE